MATQMLVNRLQAGLHQTDLYQGHHHMPIVAAALWQLSMGSFMALDRPTASSAVQERAEGGHIPQQGGSNTSVSRDLVATPSSATSQQVLEDNLQRCSSKHKGQRRGSPRNNQIIDFSRSNYAIFLRLYFCFSFIRKYLIRGRWMPCRSVPNWRTRCNGMRTNVSR